MKNLFALVSVSALLAAPLARAHEWHRHDDPQFANAPFISPYASGPKAGAVKLLAAAKDYSSQGSDAGGTPPSFTPPTLGAATLFAQAFGKFNPAVRCWWDATNFYVGGDGTPAHSMMVGISSWQRQLPLPTYYFGTNQWALPLYPVAAATNDLIATNKFTQGAIALAANGIPIFNPYNNTGRISAQIGELDLWGGHCGRGDDYHYHAAPLHLTNTLGISLPLAFAMDGYPVYGLVEPDGSAFATNTLDNVAGHTNGTGSYHYHASAGFPYVNGGFHGVITIVTNGAATQAGVQPVAKSPRPSGTPLGGAYIQIFTNLAPDQFQMFYSLPSNSSPAFATNYWLWTLNRASNSLTVTYSSYDGVSGPTTTNYNNWKPAPAFTSTNEPLVTTQPTNLTLTAGATATFSITAAGAGSLAYQWFKDGVELANGGGIGGVNTTTLNVTNVQAGDAGAYSVIVTNNVGITMSGAAILTVNGSPTNTPPTLTPIANRIVIPGQTLLITNSASDAETPGLLFFSLSTTPATSATINATNGLITWVTTTNNANTTNTFTVVVADNGSPNLLATQSCTVSVVGARSISQGRALTITSNLFPAGQRVSGVGSSTAFDGTVWTVPSATPFAASPKLPDLWNQYSGVTPTNIAAATNIANLTTNVIDADGEVITGYIFCDNYFELYINGVLVGVDPVPYTSFNSCVVKFKAKRPVTYAVRLVDWEENLGLGTELNGGDPNHAGDGGFIASFSDGTVTGPNWKAQSFYISPLDDQNLVVEMPDGSHNSSAASTTTTLGTNAYALHYLVPTNWYATNFNHSNWPSATTYTEAQVGVNNLFAYLNFPAQFGSSGAQFIWSGNLVLDNEVIVRFTGSAANTAPFFSAVPTNRYVINAGVTLTVTNTATDAEVPPQTLVYTLPTAPAGTTINTNTGVVTWVPTTNFYDTTNLFRVVATDNSSPQLSATNTFTAVVNPPFAAFSGSLIFLRPTTNSISLSTLSLSNVTTYFEFGTASGLYTNQTLTTNLVANQPVEVPFSGLQANTRYYYRARLQYPGDTSFKADVEHSFMTQRAPGNPFTFTIFGDSHPERVNVMFDTNFYNLTLNTIASDKPDFQMMVGDDFSVDNIPTNTISQPLVEARYTLQRPYLSQVANSASLFLVNGNHEEASRWAYLNTNLVAPGVNTVTYSNIAVWAQNARTKYFPMPVADGFYSGMTNDSLPDIGPLRSCYAWTWGDALFVTIDPYWYSTNSVDTAYAQTQHPNANVWLISHGDPQYFWLKSTLENSRAKFKFVFAHHVMGTGRGGADDASFYEWGGKNANGTWGFDANRPTWPEPIHQLMVANNVSAFVQGHDHIWVHQQLDGLVYQTLPNPADNRYSLFNADAYTNNLIYKTGNSGYGRFSVGPGGVTVDYVRTILPTNLIPVQVGTNGAPAGVTNGTVDYSYIIYPFTISTATNTPAPTATNTVWVTASASSGTNITNLTLTYIVGVTSNTIAMFDDGAHQDGASGDGVYGAQIPAFPLGTTVRYYLHGVDASTRQATEPSGAPINTNLYSYTVGANTPPSLTPIPNYNVNPLTTLLVTNVASDSDVPAQTLTFSLLTNAVSGANIDVNTGLFSWTPSAGQANSTNSFVVVVTDNGVPPLSATQAFSVVVAPGASSLVIANTSRTPTTPGAGVAANVSCTVTSTAAITGVTLYYVVSGVTNPVTMFDDGAHNDGAAGDGVFGGQIPGQTLGYTVSYYIRAQDAAANTTTDPAGAPQGGNFYAYTVGGNTAPSLGVISNRTVNVNTTLVVTNSATDAQSPPQALSYALTVKPTGANIDVNTGVITWTPTSGQANTTNTFTTFVTDNGVPPMSATNSFLVTVPPLPQPLVVTNTTRSPASPTSANAVNITSTVLSGSTVTNVTLYYVIGAVTNTVTMFDDGLHNDGAASNGVYGAQIPAQSAGTTVSYFVQAQDATASVTNDPAGAPDSKFSYTVVSAGTGWSMLKLPDTGQTTKFSTLTGEDADYLTNAPSYTDNGNGTITDNITGLMWQKADSAEISWTNALDFAVTNTTGSFNDWRLPTIHELHSIVTWAGNPPQFPTNFTLTLSGNTNFWWTMDTRVGSTNNVWNVGNGGTARSSAKTDTLSSGGTNYYHARLVRGAPAPTNSVTHSYTTNGDGTVTDVDTGLMWVQAEVTNAVDWSNALAYAEGLTFAGYTDWRLPNIREMRSLNDEKFSNPSVNTNTFASNKVARYWSSTTQNNRTTNAWYVDFQFGNTGQDPKISNNWVRVVRGPVSSAPANNPPVLTQQIDRTVNPTYTLLVTNVATDPDVPAQALTFSLLASPTNSSINTNTGVFTFTPALGQLGTTNTVTVVVTDNGSPPKSVTNSFKAIVIANTAPVLAAIANRTNNPGDLILITNVTTDAEAPPQTFTYTLTTAPAGATINPTNGVITWATSGANANTTNNFTVVVADNGVPSLIASRSFAVTITGASGVITYNIVLGRPTANSISASVLASNDLQVYFEFGTNSGVYTAQTATNLITNGAPRHLTMDSLQPNTRYYYRMRYSATGGLPFAAGSEGKFATQRARGSTFTFLIEADPHNRDNVPDVWKLAFTNMLADNADFLVDLGDTFFEEKVAATNAYFMTQAGIYATHQEVRDGFFGLAGHSLPLFLVGGNHDPELGWLATSTNNAAVWSVQARQYFFPVPVPNQFYSGATNIDPYTLAPRDAYYAFEWGDALFVGIDPFWYTSPKPGADGWAWTLGTNQYYWLKRTLENSTAKFKFVFAHHLIGGWGGAEARGGLSWHTNFEWGGSTTNGGYDFPTKRPGWPAPIKDLLLSNNVQVFFHGHDHLYVKEEYYAPGNTSAVPTFIYQEVPQPSQTIFSTNAAPGYGYTNAGSTVIASSGHLRVTVSPTNTHVDYVRVFLPANEGAGRTNKMISHSYDLPAPVVTNQFSMVKLPDTGQVGNYTPTSGEDSDYLINSPNFTDNGNGTVTDNITGLMWQKVDGGEMTLSNALLYPATNLNTVYFAGYADWRVPTVHELMSIENHDKSNPAIDTNYFTSPGVSGGTWNEVYWWSRDQRVGSTNQWCANAGGGVGPKPLHETISAGGTLNYRIRCVRGAPAPSAARVRFVNNGNGTVTDADTGLTWQQGEIGAATDWTNALNYCEALVLGGFQDWRLPNIKELESLNDETRASPSINTNFFPGAKAARYWSSTTQFGHTTNAWWNEFINGIVSYDLKPTTYWVRAVRGNMINTAPLLAALSNLTLNAGVTVQFTNAATDAQTAPGFLTFSLLTSVTNASLGAADGLFTWRPAVAQAGTTNYFTVVAADSGSPILSATQLFSITVNPLTNPPGVAALNYVGAQLQLQITGDAGPDYTVQATTNLTAPLGGWTNLFTTNSPVTPFLWLDPNANSYTSRFYRVLIGP